MTAPSLPDLSARDPAPAGRRLYLRPLGMIDAVGGVPLAGGPLRFDRVAVALRDPAAPAEVEQAVASLPELEAWASRQGLAAEIADRLDALARPRPRLRRTAARSAAGDGGRQRDARQLFRRRGLPGRRGRHRAGPCGAGGRRRHPRHRRGIDPAGGRAGAAGGGDPSGRAGGPGPCGGRGPWSRSTPATRR